MSTLNRYGATSAAVLTRFALAGYTPAADDFGGTASIEAELDVATDMLTNAMPARLRDQIARPDLCIVEQRATAGQLTATLPIIPTIAGKVHLWRGQPSSFVSRPVLGTGPWWGGASLPGDPGATPPGSLTELDESAFSVVAATGVVTLTEACQRNDMIVATWDVDTSSASFAIASLAGLVAIGAAAALGGKVYPQASATWDHVTRMAEQWADAVDRIGKGSLVPTELRLLRWWSPVEPDAEDGGRIGSVRAYRGG